MDRYIKDSGMKLADTTDDSAQGSEEKHSAYPWAAEEAVAQNPKQNSDGDAQPQFSVERNAAIEGPTQVQSSVAGASDSDAVVSVRLSSELQQSFLQARNAELKNLAETHNAPNVEEEVAKERMQDVYIHDGFGKEEQADDKKVREVNANKDLKP